MDVLEQWQRKIERKSAVSLNTAALKNDKYNSNKEEESIINSELTQWPVQLRLVNPNAAYFEGANFINSCRLYCLCLCKFS